jgi:hypothetical protein
MEQTELFFRRRGLKFAASMDALGAFTHMKDNLPTWINRVSELATHTHKKQYEWSKQSCFSVGGA